MDSASGRTAGARPLRVVLADDHARYRNGLARAIDAHTGLELAEAVEDGVRALEAVDRHAPEIALLDVRMPRLDGLGTARRLRDYRTAVVLLSGNPSSAMAREADAAGAVALLTKDLSRREICATLVRLA